MLTPNNLFVLIGPDTYGATLKEYWSYALVIEIILWLSANYRTHIYLEIHKRAQCTNNTKAYNKKAVKWIF